MATSTSYLGLSKPEYSDNADISVINGNMDKLDTVGRHAGGIIVNGNKTASGVTAAIGDYVMLVNSSITSRADGFYTAKKAIPANTAIDSTYLNETAPITGGAVNSLNGKMLPEEIPVSGNATVTVGSFTSSIIGYKTLSVMELLMFVNGVTITNSTTFGQITVKPKRNEYLSVVDDTNGTPINGNMYLNTNGTLTYYGDAITNKKIAVFGTYTFR